MNDPTQAAVKTEARRGRFRSGLRAVAVGAFCNLGLILLKGTFGILGHSSALVADAVHSGADLVNSLFAFVSLLISRRPPDPTHPYGHGRAEALSATFASFIIGAAGLLVAWDAIGALRSSGRRAPDWLTLWAALVALVIKLALATYAGRVAGRIHSKAVLADARDHLSDVVASTFVVAGILIAQFGLPLFDPLAGFVVAGFIVFTAFGIFREAARELMDTSLSAPLAERVLCLVEQVPGVERISGIAGRSLADITVVEIHLDVDPAMSVGDAGRLIDEIKRRVIAAEPEINHVVVEMNSGLNEPEGLAVSRRPPTR